MALAPPGYTRPMSDYETPPPADADRTITDSEDTIDPEAPIDSLLVNPPREDADRPVPTVDADEAHRLRLVSGVHEPEGFLGEVLDTAAGIAATAPIASRLTTVALRDGGHADFDAALQWEALAQPVTLATDDLQEGIAAARERRPARFAGR